MTPEQQLEIARDRQELDCERCGYWPCVCGEPEFETWVTQEQLKSEEVD
jgi:hypothetical protein